MSGIGSIFATRGFGGPAKTVQAALRAKYWHRDSPFLRRDSLFLHRDCPFLCDDVNLFNRDAAFLHRDGPFLHLDVSFLCRDGFPFSKMRYPGGILRHFGPDLARFGGIMGFSGAFDPFSQVFRLFNAGWRAVVARLCRRLAAFAPGKHSTGTRCHARATALGLARAGWRRGAIRCLLRRAFAGWLPTRGGRRWGVRRGCFRGVGPRRAS